MPLRVLLVDDSTEFLETAGRFLAADGRLTVVASVQSGEAAMEAVQILHPDLVLMDLAMPGIGGIEATRRIKQLPQPPCVVILTLYDNPEYRALARQVAADGFVSKADFAEQLLPLVFELFPAAESTEVGGSARMKHVLVVDDSATMRRMVIACLQPLSGLRISEASSGLEAIERLVLSPVDLIILDLNMPDMHGLDVLRFLQQHPTYRNIPVLVLTTRGDAASRQAALQAGAARYLTKPFQPHVLVAHVKELLGQ